jgi:hypothetical protein
MAMQLLLGCPSFQVQDGFVLIVRLVNSRTQTPRSSSEAIDRKPQEFKNLVTFARYRNEFNQREEHVVTSLGGPLDSCRLRAFAKPKINTRRFYECNFVPKSMDFVSGLHRRLKAKRRREKTSAGEGTQKQTSRSAFRLQDCIPSFLRCVRCAALVGWRMERYSLLVAAGKILGLNSGTSDWLV